MQLRHRRRVREVSVADVTDASLRRSSAAATFDQPDSPDFDAAFDRLTVDQRALLVLHHVHGYGVREIGIWLGIPTGTVKWRLNRARNALRQELES
jgi:RNA polymerase sigma-70 factor (ECF subfamily)